MDYVCTLNRKQFCSAREEDGMCSLHIVSCSETNCKHSQRTTEPDTSGA